MPLRAALNVLLALMGQSVKLRPNHVTNVKQVPLAQMITLNATSVQLVRMQQELETLNAQTVMQDTIVMLGTHNATYVQKEVSHPPVEVLSVPAVT